MATSTMVLHRGITFARLQASKPIITEAEDDGQVARIEMRRKLREVSL